jgi:hypothetical protein
MISARLFSKNRTSTTAPKCLRTWRHEVYPATQHVRSNHQSKKLSDESPTASKRQPKNTTSNVADPSMPSFSLFQQIREARPAVRYTVYAGLGLMATVETTFWFNVLKAKFFPSTSVEEQQKAEQLLNDVRSAIKGYRGVWMGNYGRYYGVYLWGLGYGGLNGL